MLLWPRAPKKDVGNFYIHTSTYNNDIDDDNRSNDDHEDTTDNDCDAADNVVNKSSVEIMKFKVARKPSFQY